MKRPVSTLLGLASGAAPLPAQQPTLDTLPAAVVQRFVDAADAANVGAKMSTAAPEAAFTSLPSGPPLATGRDGVRAIVGGLIRRAWVLRQPRAEVPGGQ